MFLTLADQRLFLCPGIIIQLSGPTPLLGVGRGGAKFRFLPKFKNLRQIPIVLRLEKLNIFSEIKINSFTIKRFTVINCFNGSRQHYGGTEYNTRQSILRSVSFHKFNTATICVGIFEVWVGQVTTKYVIVDCIHCLFQDETLVFNF